MSDSYSFPEEEYILIGKVIKAHGLRGEIKINPFSGQPTNLNHYPKLVLVNKEGQLSSNLAVQKSRATGKITIVKLAEVDDRNGAEKLCGMGVLIHKDDLPQLGENEFYYHQFINLTVKTDKGIELGIVSNIFSNGAQDIMEIEGTDRQYLVPILKDIIVSHDDNCIIIAPPPGLLDLSNS